MIALLEGVGSMDDYDRSTLEIKLEEFFSKALDAIQKHITCRVGAEKT